MDEYEGVHCIFCKSFDINLLYVSSYKYAVCNDCKSKLPYHGLITKTDAKKKYLLTEDELSNFLHIRRPNKHGWTDLYLYLEIQVRKFALDRWGAEEKIEEERRRRERMQIATKNRKYEERVSKLRRSVRLVRDAVPSKHTHTFYKKDGRLLCDCGFELECEEI